MLRSYSAPALIFGFESGRLAWTSVRHCGLVVSAPAWDGTGCEFDSWQCRIYIPCSLNLRLLGSLRGSLGTCGLTQKLCLKKLDKIIINKYNSELTFGQSIQNIVNRKLISVNQLATYYTRRLLGLLRLRPRSIWAFTRASPSLFDLGSGFALNAGKPSLTFVRVTLISVRDIPTGRTTICIRWPNGRPDDPRSGTFTRTSPSVMALLR